MISSIRSFCLRVRVSMSSFISPYSIGTSGRKTRRWRRQSFFRTVNIGTSGSRYFWARLGAICRDVVGWPKKSAADTFPAVGALVDQDRQVLALFEAWYRLAQAIFLVEDVHAMLGVIAAADDLEKGVVEAADDEIQPVEVPGVIEVTKFPVAEMGAEQNHGPAFFPGGEQVFLTFDLYGFVDIGCELCRRQLQFQEFNSHHTELFKIISSEPIDPFFREVPAEGEADIGGGDPAVFPRQKIEHGADPPAQADPGGQGHASAEAVEAGGGMHGQSVDS
jgi:hypothetical protein